MHMQLLCIKHSGSEFDVVIMPIAQAAPMLLTRNLLYTAMTRAKKMLIIIGNKNVIDFMINNTDSKKRNTGLEYKLRKL
ncbi:MAG: ATP-binding domain-containing protein [Clostridia bacterium]|jgi:exodeoxyribonuclease V alpha subunit|nr:helicase RecD/TraA family [Clostridium sp. CAG:273]